MEVTTLPATVARTRQRLQVRTTFVRPRYHQGPRWAWLRESLGPEDDAFRSGAALVESTVVSRIIWWPSKQLVSTVKAIGPRHLLGALSDFDLGADLGIDGYRNYFYYYRANRLLRVRAKDTKRRIPMEAEMLASFFQLILTRSNAGNFREIFRVTVICFPTELLIDS